MRADTKGAGASAAGTDGGDVEVVASGTALSIVSGWLGMSAEEALAEAGPAAAAQAPLPSRRPQFLGLGAKYLPHHKAVETATALDSKLRRRLERGMAARRAAEEEEAELAGGRAAGGGGGAAAGSKQAAGRGAAKGVTGPGLGKRPAANGTPNATPNDGGSDSEGEERKGAPNRRARPGAAGAGGGGVAGAAAAPGGGGSKAAREAQLLYAPVEGAGKKGRSGKRRKVAGAG